jgi:hypothetical protein
MILRRVIHHFRKQEWTAIALDFLIVVAGILLAFQITEWNEARRERAREHDYLARIASELQQSMLAMESGIRLAREREELGRFLLRSVNEPELVRAEPGRFVLAVLVAGYTYSPVVRAHTFDEIKSAGDLAIIRDKSLLLDLTEFHTDIQGETQWSYIRELNQTEYMKRSAGILSYELLVSTPYDLGIPDIAVEDALAAHARMLERPDFLEWLPNVTHRYDDIRTYEGWLAAARELHAQILTVLGQTPPGSGQQQPP